MRRGGEYIALLDSDDEWFPRKLERQLRLFKKSEVDKLGFVGCAVLDVDDINNRYRIYKVLASGDITKNLLTSPTIHSCSSVVIKKGSSRTGRWFW